jgi:hypothetical protein
MKDSAQRPSITPQKRSPFARRQAKPNLQDKLEEIAAEYAAG